MLQKQAK